MSPVRLGAGDTLLAANFKHGVISAIWASRAENQDWSVNHVCRQERHQAAIKANGCKLFVYTFLPGTPQHALFWRYVPLAAKNLYCTLKVKGTRLTECVGADVPLTVGTFVVGVTEICVRAKMDALFPPPHPPPTATSS